MGRSIIPPALAELAHPSTPEAQVTALRNLKNEVVGHEQRKELAVTHGVVRPLARLLRVEARRGGKRRRGGDGAGRGAEWSTEDELRFQATLVVGSLANGGPAFVAPLLKGGVLPPLLDALNPAETHEKLVTTALKTLSQIVDAGAQEKTWLDATGASSRSSVSAAVVEHIYTKPVIESLAEILAQLAGTSNSNQQIYQVVGLIVKTCRQNNHKKMLVDAGILELLADKLVGIAAFDDAVPKAKTKQSYRDRTPTRFLPDVLDAISAIIRDSHFYTARFLYSQPIQQLFGWPKERTTTAYDNSASQSTSWDRLIPRVQTMTSKSDPYTKSWPALGSYTNASGDRIASDDPLPSLGSLQQTPNRSVITDESESSLFIWLVYVARRGEGRERLSACWLLALLKKFGERWPLNDPSKTTRERHFSYLVVPLVVKMIEESSPTSEQSKKAYALSPLAREETRIVLERSPLVLAELVAGNKALQSAAVDAKILPTLVQILKKSFEAVTTSSKPLWQPRSSASAFRDSSVDPASSTLGRPGLNADTLHAFTYRENALLALAAIVGEQDGLRKIVIEMGAVAHIVESLVPYSEGTENAASTTKKGGNPETVLIAACKATRSLSRSVSVLRTSLIDHGIAQPIFDLLTHHSVNVQIAATEVITNLVLELSPMRTEIIEAGALKTLCEHCRSANFDLRLISLWALKHMCLGLPYAMKIKCLDELGVGWLVQVLNGEPTKPTMATPNAAGEQVDILNAVDEPHMDVDEEPSSDEEDEDTMADSIPSMRRHQRPGSRYTSATNIRDRLQQIRDDEQDSRLNSEREDIRIQEHALDFLRNFITEEKASGDMIDHLLKTFGHTRFFELMDAKLRPKNTPSSTTTTTTAPSHRLSFPPAPTQSTPSSPPSWSAYPAPELIEAATFVLVHIANGRPSHRHLLISQTPLMHHLLPLLTHPRRQVRLACAWMLNNLVYVEDHSDEPAARERALNLRHLGFEDGARVLGRDVDLDIRERAKTAIDQFAKLLGGTGAGAGAGGSSFAVDGALGRLSGLHGGWRHDSR
ncbi:armadillo repeat domain-containing protein [Dothidotthia symphoricarpi CBS 119687]|uniref:Armadillo repeat domain-containing protein n=1 Tax=Dothidotthia symphoricarpi CBS 119687 TaxID=1392245 RepID=A0A6A6AB92_9PLEO|nr:armadillo repeat domain-containing protein [Dothidotthia symphoricarpi CBS 119687]KAF2129039.1 armadillo repeat domain-containing protein [Dothidotthia symphoricarpi CBS 119687]